MRSQTSRRLGCSLLGGAALAGWLLAPGTARASTVLEFPDNGSEQMGRGGAWVARASDPLAAFYNPAGLAGQQTRLTLQSNLSLEHTCFTRIRANNDVTSEPLAPSEGAVFPKVCNSLSPSPGPQLGITYRLTDRIGLGFLPLLAPSGAASALTFPTFVNGQPAPQRYLLISDNLVLITPTVAAGFEVAHGLRLGASFQFGIASFDFKTSTAGTNGPADTGATGDNLVQPTSNDVLADFSGKQLFVPGFTVGVIYSPIDDLDIAGWYKYSAPVGTDADLKTQAAAFSGAAALGKPQYPFSDLGSVGHVRLVIPMEAKVGFRFHLPRKDVAYDEHTRDPLSQDMFDAEVDLTYANNSAASNLQIRFPGDANGDGTVSVPHTGGSAPPIADVNHGFKDVYGVRLGGDFNALPDRLAVRAGAYFESNGQNPQYMNVDTVGSQKIGLALGGTYRIHFGPPEKTRAIEVSIGYMHVFYADETNNGGANGTSGVNAIAGTACNPMESPEPAGTTCSNNPGNPPKNRTIWPVNLGTITNSVNVFNAGVSYRF